MEQLKYFLLKNKRTLIAFIGSFLAIIIVFGCLFLVMTPVQRWRMFNNPIGYKALAMWHSLRKIPNVVHFPYWFRDSKLDAYYITVSSTDLVKLNGSLPLSDDGLTYGHLYEDDKSYVSATFKDPLSGYESKVKMRYRGLVDNNWSSEKKALRIKFDKADFFEGRAALNLMIPGDREYFAGLLSAYRAKKFGVFTPPFKPVKVFINGRDFGVYFASEPWSKELLARSGYVDTDNIFSKIDKEAVPGYSVFFEQNLPDWKSYTFKSTDGAASEFEELKALLSLTNNADDKEFAEKIGTLVDLDKFYHWQLINTLIGSAAQNDLENIVLIFRKETGKFEFAMWDPGLFEPNGEIYQMGSLLARRILSQRLFFEKYSEVLNSYVSDEKNLADDLAYYDKLDKDLRPEFYADQAKLDNDLMFSQRVAEARNLVVRNFEYAKNLGNYDLSIKDKVAEFKPAASKTAEFTGSFSRFNEVFENADSFIAKNPQFLRTGAQTVSLPAGTHIFNKTVVVPQGLSLVIGPGAELLFAPKISLISYSPVTAIGTAMSPISMGPLYNKEPWGVFAVVNSDKTNRFSFVHVRGGFEDALNGILFTSQFSMHNSKTIINNSVFEDGRSDDGAHIILGSVEIYNSIFRDNFADGLDMDYPSPATIKDNYFYDSSAGGDSNGDALDLSGVADTLIESNDMRSYGDKCISVGEGCTVEIKGNILTGCDLGIAVKDDSKAYITDNKILANKTAGIALYRKKQEWVIGGYADIKNSVIWGNGEEIQKDEFSKIDISDSVVKGGYAGGSNISAAVPDFKKILPFDLWQSLKSKFNG